jgi:hypothetical protein
LIAVLPDWIVHPACSGAAARAVCGVQANVAQMKMALSTAPALLRCFIAHPFCSEASVRLDRRFKGAIVYAG